MGTEDYRFTSYRGFDIATNPTGKASGALTDAFLIFEPSANPMYTVTRHVHPYKESKTYRTQKDAQAAAIEMAHTWIDAWLSRPH